MTTFKKKTLRALCSYLEEFDGPTARQIADDFGWRFKTAINYLQGNPQLFVAGKKQRGKPLRWYLLKE